MKQLAFDFYKEKQCKRCGQIKSLAAFSEGRNHCKNCRLVYKRHYHATHQKEERAYRKHYYAKNQARILANACKYYADHREKLVTYARAHRAKNPDYGKQYRAKNKDRIRAYNRQYRQENAERRRVYNQRYRAAHPKKRRRYLRNYYAKYPGKIRARNQRRRARKANAKGAFSAEDWTAICDKYGNQCVCCGSKSEPLTIDHIIPLSKGGTNSPINLQPLCLSCNSRKRDKTIDYRPF